MPELHTLTRRQREVFDLIVRAIQNQGAPPTVRDLMQLLGVHSPNAVQCHLRALERKQAIVCRAGKCRSIGIPGVRWQMVPQTPASAGAAITAKPRGARWAWLRS